jgi:hypothetical protein
MHSSYLARVADDLELAANKAAIQANKQDANFWDKGRAEELRIKAVEARRKANESEAELKNSRRSSGGSRKPRKTRRHRKTRKHKPMKRRNTRNKPRKTRKT